MRQKIEITRSGIVSLPDRVLMRDFEIAELFGVILPTVKGKIRQVLKDGVCVGDFSIGGIVLGNRVLPEFYGLDMVVAIAFRVQSHEAKVFRQWVLRKMAVAHNPAPTLYLRLPHGAMPN